MEIIMDIEKFQLNQEIYAIGADSDGGDGTREHPYRIKDGNLDNFLSILTDSCKLRLGPGVFYTKGFRAPKKFILIGSGKTKTKIKLVDNVQNYNFPHVRVISDNSWSEVFGIKDLTIDCNWNGQSVATTNGNFKIEAVVVQTIVGKAENIKVINFGCNGLDYGNAGFEAFPLSLHTFSNGEPFEYFAGYEGLIKQEDLTSIEISECEVSSPHFLNGGYCTAIFAYTNFINAGDRQPQGKRTTRSALVRNNIVNVPGGIAYGSASSETIDFLGNIAYNSKCGFNFDTDIANRINIIGNQFISCNQGINFVPVRGDKIVFGHNFFSIKEPFYNPVLRSFEESYGVRSANLLESSANYNYMICKEENKTTFINGVNGDGNVWIKQNTPQDSAEISRLNHTIDTLNEVTENLQENLMLAHKNNTVLKAAIQNHKTVTMGLGVNETLWKSLTS